MEGSVTLAVMWVCDNAARAHIDVEKAVNGTVSPEWRLPLRWWEGGGGVEWSESIVLIQRGEDAQSKQ